MLRARPSCSSPRRTEAPELKAVIITHKNLLSNLAMIDGFSGELHEEEVARGGVCWLPLYHDMGLIGCMFMGLYHPGDGYIHRLLTCSSRSRGSGSRPCRGTRRSSPLRRFRLRVVHVEDQGRGVADIDLSHWRIAFNGAEPIDPELSRQSSLRSDLRRWGFKPEAMTPGYGLAEAGLAVSFSHPLEPPSVTEFDAQNSSRSRGGRRQAPAGDCLGPEGGPRSGGRGARRERPRGRVWRGGHHHGPRALGHPGLVQRSRVVEPHHPERVVEHRRSGVHP